MRWEQQKLDVVDAGTIPGLPQIQGLVRSVQTPEFAGLTFHEVAAKSALNPVPGASAMPFDWTINPYRGCSHQCAYCLDPGTLILMADGRHKPIAQVRVGDRIIGTEFDGKYRRFAVTDVQATWTTVKPAYRVTLRDRTEIVASGDHRFLTARGWKHVTPLPRVAGQRPYLTTNNSLMGFGLGMAPEAYASPLETVAYRRGYLAGMIRGDGTRIDKIYSRKRTGKPYRITSFRLALTDAEALRRSKDYLELEGIYTTRRPFSSGSSRSMDAIHTAKRRDCAVINQLVEWPVTPDDDWQQGFLAGIFDAEGSYSTGALRISNNDREILAHIVGALDALEFPHVREGPKDNGVVSIRVPGGRKVHQRFFQAVGPATTRKLSLVGRAVKSSSDLGVISVEDLGRTQEMVDITTGTGDFFANGVVSHNCFARKTHEYLDLDAGADFDSQIVVKVNVVDVLRRELARPTWEREHVALGTNTDPYQRAEGRYQLMPGIIQALTDAGTPFSILTKGTLLRRDLPLLAEASQQVSVGLGVSLAIWDTELHETIEPGTPSPQARLALVRAARRAGLPCGVFLAPVLPWLTDRTEQLDEALGKLADAGASGVTVLPLHLRPGAREWFLRWLQQTEPDLVPRYEALYRRGAYVPSWYKKQLWRRIGPLLRKHGFDRKAQRQPDEGHYPTGSMAEEATAEQEQPSAENIPRQLTLL